MKNGKVILGVAAFIVTAASALAFKAHSKNGTDRVFGLTKVGSSNCTLSTCFFTVNGLSNGNLCKTNVNKVKTAFTGSGPKRTYWTNVTTLNRRKCAHPISKWTHIN